MVKIANNREPLDKLLNDLTNTLFLLSGDPDSKASKCHDLWEDGVRNSWQKAVLITDLSILQDTEKRNWFSQLERYAMLGLESRAPVESGVIGNLLKRDGEPSIRRILSLFTQGDKN